MVKALLAHGANVNAATTQDKNTALMWAIAEGHDDIARVLVEARPMCVRPPCRGFTPLMFAARNGDIEMAKALLAAGARVNETAPDGTHVLPFAIISGQVEFAHVPPRTGSRPERRDRRRPRAARGGRQRRPVAG